MPLLPERVGCKWYSSARVKQPESCEESRQGDCAAAASSLFSPPRTARRHPRQQFAAGTMAGKGTHGNLR